MPRYVELAAQAQFARLNVREVGFCLRCNRWAEIPAVRRFFSTASRLGDGIAWYALLATLPSMMGSTAIGPTIHMAATAGVAVLIYKAIKTFLVRERPFATHWAVKAILPPLDRYSFPSGHTMHAVAFTVMIAAYYPVLLLVVVPFAISVALSRVVLGLHYPTDVLAGAGLGGAIAYVSLALAA